MAPGAEELETGRILPKIVISSCQGHSGKTTVSIGLCAAWTEQGRIVQPFKKGADYIDPSWLSAAANGTCRNLDAFLMPRDSLLPSFERACRGADVALLEGVMGLYDSFDNSGEGSTAWMARLIGAPVILLINASRMTRSVAAMIRGYQSFEPETGVAGVILNNVSLDGHRRKLAAAIEKYCDIPVLGMIPRDGRLVLDEQHLGLRPFRATPLAPSIIERVRDAVKSFVDIDALFAIAATSRSAFPPQPRRPAPEPTVRVGIFLDPVFNFYYPENLEALRLSGAELVLIDSLRDRNLGDVDGLYIGGGFPELFSKDLESNHELRREIANAVEGGLPVYAECAGLMYLSRRLHWRQESYAMVGILPSDVEMCGPTQGHGYVVAEVAAENPWFPVGLKIKGHQFHHSRWMRPEELKYAFSMERRRETDPRVDGVIYKNCFAAYTHLHATSVPQWAESFVGLARRERAGRISLSVSSGECAARNGRVNSRGEEETNQEISGG